MRTKIYTLITAVSIISLVTSANAALPVTDAPLTTALNTQMGAANLTLRAIETTNASTLTMMTKPTAMLTGGATGLDGGSSAEAATDTAEFFPQLFGETATSPVSTSLLAAQKAAILADQIKGVIQGDVAVQQAERERKIGTNSQAEAYADSLNFGKAILSAKSIYALLGTADIKDAIVLNGAIQVQGLTLLGLIGQAISTNTEAINEAYLSSWKMFFQSREDKLAAAKLF